MIISINIVLVRTIYSSNIGAVARVLGNMGGTRLILLDPRCEVNSKARQGAAGAQKYLHSRIIYKNWQEFYEHEGQGVRIALTRRMGKTRPAWPINDIFEKLDFSYSSSHSASSENSEKASSIYLLFGPEDDGLSAEDLELVHYCGYLPTFGDFPSLNLSHATLLACYLTQSWLQKNLHSALPPFDPLIELNENSKNSDTKNVFNSFEPQKKLYFPDESIRQWLEAIGFSLEKRRASAYITLRRLLLKNQPTETDLRILDAILQQNIRKLKNKNSCSK